MENKSGRNWDNPQQGRTTTDSTELLWYISQHKLYEVDHDERLLISQHLQNRTPLAVRKRLANTNNAITGVCINGKLYSACWYAAECTTNWLQRLNQIRQDSKKCGFQFDDSKLILDETDVYIIVGASQQRTGVQITNTSKDSEGTSYYFDFVRPGQVGFNQQLVMLGNMKFSFIRMMVDHYIVMMNNPKSSSTTITNIKDNTLARYIGANDKYFSSTSWFRGFVTWFFCDQ